MAKRRTSRTVTTGKGRTHKRRGPAPRRDWQAKFLAAFEDTDMISEACKVARVSRSTAYAERQRDEDFALAWHEVELRSTESLEAEAIRRAKDGSDGLLIFMLKSRVPEVYRETQRHEHSGPEGRPLVVETDAEGVKMAHELLRRVSLN